MAEKNDQLNCSICLSDFKKPKLLECFHTFCECCLNDYISKFEEKGEFMCPLCRTAIKIPKGGASQFAGNCYVTDNFQETDDNQEKTPSCDVCKKDAESEFQCIDCDKLLCGSCKITHDVFVGCLKHDVVCLSEKTKTEEPKERIPIICQQHGKKFAVFCMNCSLVICSKCSQKEHSSHDVQNISEIGDAIDKAKRELGAVTREFKANLPTLYKVKSAIITQISILRVSTHEACKDVDRRVEEVCQTVQKQGEKIKGVLKHKQNEQEFPLNKILGDLVNLISELEAHSKQMPDDVVKYDSIDVLTVLPDFEDKLDDMKKQTVSVPSVIIPEIKYDLLNETVLFKEIGLDKFSEIETIELSFSLDEYKGVLETWVPSIKFVIEQCTLFLQLYTTGNNTLLIDLKSDNDKFPSRLPSITLLNKDKTKSITSSLDKDRWCTLQMTKATLTQKANGFINVHNNLTFKLTRT